METRQVHQSISCQKEVGEDAVFISSIVVAETSCGAPPSENYDELHRDPRGLVVHGDAHDLLTRLEQLQLAEPHVERRRAQAAVLLRHHHHVLLSNKLKSLKKSYKLKFVFKSQIN